MELFRLDRKWLSVTAQFYPFGTFLYIKWEVQGPCSRAQLRDPPTSTLEREERKVRSSNGIGTDRFVVGGAVS